MPELSGAQRAMWQSPLAGEPSRAVLEVEYFVPALKVAQTSGGGRHLHRVEGDAQGTEQGLGGMPGPAPESGKAPKGSGE